MAEIERTLWTKAQIKDFSVVREYPTSHGSLEFSNANYCYVDGSWKENAIYTEQRWFCKKEGVTENMMGAMNIIRSLSPLHAEREAMIWVIECMKTLHISEVVFATYCSPLVKMVSTPTE